MGRRANCRTAAHESVCEWSKGIQEWFVDHGLLFISMSATSTAVPSKEHDSQYLTRKNSGLCYIHLTVMPW